MRRVKYITVIIASILLLCSVVSKAETIFETFDTDPTLSDWTSSVTGSSAFTYNTLGYLDVDYVRDTINVDRYTTALSTTYDKTQEYWWEMDIRMDSSSYFDVKMGSAGLFNSSNNNAMNIMVAEYGFTNAINNKRVDWHIYLSSGGTRYKAGPQTADDAYLRFKTHYWCAPGALAYVQMDVYDILTGELVGSTGVQSIVTVAESVFYNSFGLANLYGSLHDGVLKAKIDNLYFSTESANTNPVLPSFYNPYGTEIKSVFAKTSTDSLDIAATLRNESENPAGVYIRHRVYEDENTSNPPYIDVTSSLITVPAGGEYQTESSNTGLSPNLWSLKSPRLYLLRTELLNSSMELIVAKDTVIGFRKFEVVGRNFYLNGEPVYLFGLAQTPPGRIPPSMYLKQEFIDQHIARLKSTNVNFVRMTQGPESWYEAFDRAGIMVIAGCYSGSGRTDPNVSYNLEILQTEVLRLRNHPSVVTWVTGNEFDLDAPGMITAAQSLYNAVKAMDSTRPVFLASANGLASDFYDSHPYTGWYYGSVNSFYSYNSSITLPVIYTECVGAYTNEVAGDGGFEANADKTFANVLRTIGHSYQYSSDSLWYQSYLAKELSEICRRRRSSASPICGPLPFTNAYFYDLDGGTETAKLIIDKLASSYEPLHISIECLSPHIFAGNTLISKMYILNDDPNYNPSLPAATLYVDLLDKNQISIWNDSYAISNVAYYGSVQQSVNVSVPSGAATGNYILKARLNSGTTDIAESISEIFVAGSNWCHIVNTSAPAVAVYDPQGGTLADLQTLSVPVQQITNFNTLTSFQRLIIGRNAFDTTVKNSQSQIQAFLNSGKRVLVLDQSASGVSTFNTSVWLGAGLTMNAGSEEFVNIERPQISTLMNGLARNDFRTWNNVGSESQPSQRLYDNYMKLISADLDNCTVLANGGQHLSHALLVEIFSTGGGSCILNQIYTSAISTEPKAAKYLANLIDYLIESESHQQYVEVGYNVNFGDFASESGVIFAPLTQGLIVADSGAPAYNPEGRNFRGPMQIYNSLGYLEEADGGATRSVCPLYLRTKFEISEIVVDVENSQASELEYRLIVNGSAGGWTTISAAHRQQDTFTLSGSISKNTNIKLQIESDEGLKFYSLSLGQADVCDINKDAIVNFEDFAIFAENWLNAMGTVPGE